MTMEFGEKLQELRKARSLTQEQLAEALYVSRTAVSKWESGRGYPSIDSLREVSRFFSVTIDELISPDEVVSVAQAERRSFAHGYASLVCGLLDVLPALLLVLIAGHVVDRDVGGVGPSGVTGGDDDPIDSG
jgi:transcriptional regulator with XRE-family HTH domain